MALYANLVGSINSRLNLEMLKDTVVEHTAQPFSNEWIHCVDELLAQGVRSVDLDTPTKIDQAELELFLAAAQAVLPVTVNGQDLGLEFDPEITAEQGLNVAI